MTATTAVPMTWSLGGDRIVNRIGYGAMHLTGPGMWGPPEDPEAAIRLLRRAVWDLGVNFIDTADSYGPGFNEQIIREALHPYPDDLVIATKGGMLRSGPQDWVRQDGRAPYIVAFGRPEYLRQQVELSLRNLGLERIDLYQLHRIDPVVPLEDQLGELANLQQQGKIRHIGLSGQPGVTVAQLTEARAIVDIAAVENLYNIADRSSEDVLKYAEANGIAFIPWFPLGNGDLVSPTGVLARAAKEHGVTAAQLALAWLLRHSPNTLLIPGTTSTRHLEENLAAAEVVLDEHRWAAVEELCSHIPTWRPAVSGSSAHRNTAILREIYADLTRVVHYADDDIVLHRAADAGQCRGPRAVLAHERALLEMAAGTLVMDVEQIAANDHFGAVLGVLRARRPQRIAMPFCGLWRFRDGKIVEHWENAYDAAVLRSPR